VERFVLDTNVISELGRKKPDPAVVAFMSTLEDFRVSVIVFHELAYGVERAKVDAKDRLARFVNMIRVEFGDGAIAVDLTIAEAAGRLRAFAQTQGRVLHEADALIAATTSLHDATLVTRNIKNFEGLEVKVHNPFSE
jgi:toxin FitB